MEVLSSVTYLIIGFGLLVLGADFLVDGSASIARKFGVSNLIIGLTLVSIATSFPELVVSVDANLAGSPDLAVANVLGSTISNILLILGLVAIAYNVRVSKSTVSSEIPYATFVILLVLLLANDIFANGNTVARSALLHLSRADGIILLAFFGVFLYYTYSLLKGNNDTQRHTFKVFDDDKYSLVTQLGRLYSKVRGKQDILTIGEVNVHPFGQSILILLAGLGMLILGGNSIVSSTTKLAEIYNIPEFFLGLTVVALGTSLPELATSITAYRKGNSDMAVGNIIGSNIFNMLFVLGVASVISPLSFNIGFNFDLLVALIASFSLAIILVVKREKTLTHVAGIFFVWGYFLYLLIKFLL